jgi:hypothetical protein
MWRSFRAVHSLDKYRTDQTISSRQTEIVNKAPWLVSAYRVLGKYMGIGVSKGGTASLQDSRALCDVVVEMRQSGISIGSQRLRNGHCRLIRVRVRRATGSDNECFRQIFQLEITGGRPRHVAPKAALETS